MPTSPDFRALQVRTEKIIASGSNGPNRILVYSWAADGSPSGEGAINPAVFNTSSIGTDVFLFLSGAAGQRGTSNSYSTVVFGGDFFSSGSGHVSGNFTTTGSGYFVGNVFVTSSLYVSGNFTATGSGFVSGNVSVGGAGYFVGNLVTSASAFVSSNLTVSGAAYVSGNIRTSGSMFVSGNFYLTGSEFVSGNVFISSSLYTSGNATISGNLFVSGVGYFSGGLSGSHTKLVDGSSAIIAGANITVTTGANGAITIASSISASSAGAEVSFDLTDYAATTNTTSTIVGQRLLNGANYSLYPIYLRGVLACATGTITASIRLYNATSGAYVHISGANNYYLTASTTTPTYLESVNLVGAANFSTSSMHIYELHLSTSNATYPVYAGGWHFAVSASGVPGPSGSSGSSTTVVAGPRVTVDQSGSTYYVTASAPDSSLPRLAWFSPSKVFVVPSKMTNNTGSYTNKTIRLTLQDGIQRTFVGGTLYVSSSGSGQLGLDTGGSMVSIGGDTWYYLYIVPSGSNSNTSSLSVIASAQSPTGTTTWGPSGYTNFRYIGAVFYKTTGTSSNPAAGDDSSPAGGIQPFYQTDAKSFTYFGAYALYSGSNELPTSSVNVTAPTQTSTYPLPTVISKLYGNMVMVMSSTSGGDNDTVFKHRIYLPAVYLSGLKPYLELYGDGLVSRRVYPVSLPLGYPTEGHSYTITHRNSVENAVPSSYTVFFRFDWTGYEDAYLDSSYSS